ncbi:Hypothetical predicted protein [Octopus vulgaris]|uniref:Uncharacterized protein n=1 Tax=Octopus vulgaris TaxID=6645 RepID=A0AA36FDN0_OCTVU|nr:Hypothetical predicted protein [Octopus vulgaris]
MCVFTSETPKFHAAPADGNGELLLTISPQLSFTLSSCILQLTCDGSASRPGGAPIRQGNGKPALMSQPWLREGTNNWSFSQLSLGILFPACTNSSSSHSGI